MTSGPNHNEDPDTEGTTVPPYEGRRKSADVGGAEEATKDDAHSRWRHRPRRERWTRSTTQPTPSAASTRPLPTSSRPRNRPTPTWTPT